MMPASVSPEKDTVPVTVVGEIYLKQSLFTEESTENKLCFGSAEFNQHVAFELINSIDQEVEFQTSTDQSANATIVLSKDTIEVEEFISPALVETVRTPLDSTSLRAKRTFFFAGTDSLSDGQLSNLSAEYVASLININGDSVKLSHISINSIELSEITEEKTDENITKLTMIYNVHYIEDSVNKVTTLAPYYFQKKKSEPVFDVVTGEYLIADTIMSYKDRSANCEVYIKKVVTHSLAPNDTIDYDYRRFQVLNVGKPGDETLYVHTTVPTNSNSYNTETTEKAYGNFILTTHSENYEWRASFDNTVIGHTDRINMRVCDIKWQEGLSKFEFDFTGELKVIKDEVVFEEEKSGEEGYLGTRVFTISVTLNGKLIGEFTGKTFLFQGA
jgi:hypothetical protein